MKNTLTFLFLVLPYAVFAQFTISGRVLNHDDSRPIANVNVFLSNATIGGKTADDGTFKLPKVKPGKYDLIISIVGFSTIGESVTIDNADVPLPDIYLFPKVVALNEITITSKEAPDRERNLDLFKNEFLGTSDLAKECKIVNPELLDFSYDEKSKTLSAQSVDFLIIENRALGYRIKYLLSDFRLNNYDPNARQFFYEGSVLFEELKGTPLQEEQWKKRREEIYANSIAHFLRAAIDKKLIQEGFSVLRFLINPERPPDSLINEKIKLFNVVKDRSQYRDSLSFWIKKLKLPKLLPKQIPASLTDDDVIKKTNKHGVYAFECGGDALYIIYNKTHQFNAASLSHLSDQNNTASTLVFFNMPFALFDNNGTILNPGSLTYSGVWANKRIAELLPLNYEPRQTEPPIDSTLFKKIDSILKTYIAGHNIEKAYLHFDKPYYAAGDTIYFKAYVTNPLYDLSTLSGILSVELISPANDIYGAIKLKLIDGMAAGDFALSDTLRKGNYRLRAYTNTMRNAGEEYFFDQYLSIVNVPAIVSQPGKTTHSAGDKNQTAKLSLLKPALNKIDVQFFPEGGNLVNGVTSKIAFKTIAPNGLGAAIKGTITDEQGQQAGTFASQHLGMGIITLKPMAGKRYQANITCNDSTKAIFDLPETTDTGYVLNVNNSDPQNIRINIIAGEQNHQAQINLVAQSNGVIYSCTAVKLANKNFTTFIPKNTFPDGIVQFTLFSANGEPMNERLIFIRNPDQLNLKMGAESPIYHPRQKVKIKLIATNKDYQPAAGNFSVAVTDESKLPTDEDNESTILSDMLLTSDLKGYVERPNFYFNSKNGNTDTDLDVLMLTQGYHRFEWKQILGDKFGPAVFQLEKITTVSGIVKTTGGKPIPYCKVSMLSVSNVFFSLDTIADAEGRFVFQHFLVRDSMRYIIQATDEQVRKNTLIEINDVKPPKLSGNKNAPDGNIKESDSLTPYLNFSSNFQREQLKQGIGKQVILLKEVAIKGKAEKKYLKHSDNLNGPGMANEVITADQLPPGCPVLTDCLAGHLHGIQFINGMPYYERLQTLVMIDGIQINAVSSDQHPKQTPEPSVADIVNTLSVNDIASVEIITDASLAAIYGVRGGGGVILITTKRWGDDSSGGSNFKPKFAYYSPVGYYKARIFYSPRYDLPKINTTFPDLRTTIYWNPILITDKNGSASFEFFNADTKGNYRIVVEGIDDKGSLGRQVYNYKVE
jgi:TonB-dependent SusC/RagA subfamily outer membrane receptor